MNIEINIVYNSKPNKDVYFLHQIDLSAATSHTSQKTPEGINIVAQRTLWQTEGQKKQIQKMETGTYN